MRFQITAVTMAWVFLLPPVHAGESAAGSAPTFVEDFSGNALDLTRWSPHGVSGVDSRAYAPAAAGVRDGHLDLSGPGMVTTFGLFSQRYGRFEIRCRMTPGARFQLRSLSGTLPSITGLEIKGGEIRFSNHWGTEQTTRSYSGSAPEMSGWHVVTVVWAPGQIAWFIDGKERFRSVDGVPREPLYLVLEQTAIETSQPSPLSVDYVRVWQRPIP